jgi:adenylosuccinate synthase
MIKFVDVIYGLSWGDEGKGKIANALAEKYDYVCRWNGGPNAGHTVYLNDKKYKTHMIPSGIFKGKKCIIGPGCVVNVKKFFEEIEYLKASGFDTSLVKVSPHAHIITEEHIQFDVNNLKKGLGTTGQGIAPCYADKMLRKGIRAKDLFPSEYLWDGKLEGKVLCEGAQSVWLDIDHGCYPFVTSSTTMPYGACSLGFSPQKIRRLIGVAKIYDTKSGVDPLFPESLWDDETLNKIITIGEEFGSTTGRKRMVNWLNVDKLMESIKISGCTDLVINKCDILQAVGTFKLKFENKLVEFSSLYEMQRFLDDVIRDNTDIVNIQFSGHKENVATPEMAQ